MAISDLIGDKRTSIDPGVASSVDGVAFGRALRHLEQYEFWDIASKPALRASATGDRNRRRIP